MGSRLFLGMTPKTKLPDTSTTNRLPDTSTTKMVLFRRGREEQSQVCSHDESCASPTWEGKKNSFYREKKEV